MAMKKLIVAAVGVALFVCQAGLSAWGMEVHRLITKRAIDGLPADVKPFYMARARTSSSNTPSIRICGAWPICAAKWAPEDPNHFLPISTASASRRRLRMCRATGRGRSRNVGAEKANKNGRLPWRAEEVFNRLVAAFNDLQKGHLCRGQHPLFVGRDGALRGRRGISRFSRRYRLRRTGDESARDPFTL